jgi:hypothetical protein
VRRIRLQHRQPDFIDSRNHHFFHWLSRSIRQFAPRESCSTRPVSTARYQRFLIPAPLAQLVLVLNSMC